MTRVVVCVLAWVVVAAGAGSTDIAAAPAVQAPGQYQVVKVCPLLTAAEAKKLAPWEPILDQLKVEEEGFTGGSSCTYPTFIAQVMQFRQATIDALSKDASLEAVSGIGDAAWLRNNRNRFGELLVKVGPHLLTIQLDISTGKTFESVKPTLLELGKAFAAKLR